MYIFILIDFTISFCFYIFARFEAKDLLGTRYSSEFLDLLIILPLLVLRFTRAL